jgi:uncharacterized protein YjbJ (UPF0337 family)
MEVAMNWDRVEGNWKQIKGNVKTKWGKLTDDDLTAINGKREQLVGKLQERYGIAKDQARKEVDDWFRAQTWQRGATFDVAGPAFQPGLCFASFKCPFLRDIWVLHPISMTWIVAAEE